uniref:TonB-dependent receptor domain-containing protein n=1 Tax=Aquisalimonas sp. TaxID=1872621 RepID=UPI0025BCD1E7
MHFNKPAAAAAVAVCLAPLSASGDDPIQLNPLVVTPTLSAQTVDESLSSVTVIDREKLDREQPRALTDALRGQPGFDFISNGSFGKNTSVYTRGTGSESTVLLIDGIRIRSATSGDAPWQFIPPQLLDRVEHVRGPRSSLYGADAVGGVMQGFTPDGRDRDQHWIQGGAGSHGSHEYGAGFAGSSGGTAWSLGANHFHTDGTAIRDGGDDKGFYNTSGLGRISHTFDNGAELGLLGFRAQGHTEFDGGETDFVAQTVGANTSVPVTRNWVSRLQLTEGRNEEETLQGGSQSVFDTRTRTARLDNTIFHGSNELIIGGEFQRDEVESTTDFEEDRRDNRAAFAQYLVNLGDADIQLSSRFDSNEAFGDHVTGSIAMGQRLDNHHRIRLSYGTAFRAPTFNDLYTPLDPTMGNFEGNPDLS